MIDVFYSLLAKMRPIINAKGIERAANLPNNTLGKHYRWVDGKPNGQPCNETHFPAIVRTLCAVYGVVEIAGWRVTCDTDGPAIFFTKYIPDRDIKVIETSSNFEYMQPEWRRVLDDFDFSYYFRK